MRDGIAFCGLECRSCPALLATARGDEEALAEVAARWSRVAGREIRAEAIMCDGCESDTGRVNEFCAVCAIRKCGRSRGFSTCADCADYPCRTLLDFSPFESECRPRLDRLRRE